MLCVTELGRFDTKGAQSHLMENSVAIPHTCKTDPVVSLLFDVYRRIFNSVYSAVVPGEPSLCDLSVW